MYIIVHPKIHQAIFFGEDSSCMASHLIIFGSSPGQICYDLFIVLRWSKLQVAISSARLDDEFCLQSMGLSIWCTLWTPRHSKSYQLPLVGWIFVDIFQSPKNPKWPLENWGMSCPWKLEENCRWCGWRSKSGCRQGRQLTKTYQVNRWLKRQTTLVKYQTNQIQAFNRRDQDFAKDQRVVQIISHACTTVSTFCSLLLGNIKPECSVWNYVTWLPNDGWFVALCRFPIHAVVIALSGFMLQDFQSHHSNKCIWVFCHVLLDPNKW